MKKETKEIIVKQAGNVANVFGAPFFGLVFLVIFGVVFTNGQLLVAIGKLAMGIFK